MKSEKIGNKLIININARWYDWLLENENKFIEIDKYKVWVEDGGFVVDGPELDEVEIIIAREEEKQLKEAKIFKLKTYGETKINNKKFEAKLEPEVYDYLIENEARYVVINKYIIWNEGKMFFVDGTDAHCDLNDFKIEVSKKEKIESNNIVEQKEEIGNKKIKTILICVIIIIICSGFKWLYDSSVESTRKKEEIRTQEKMNEERKEEEKKKKEEEERLKIETEKYKYILNSNQTYNELLEGPEYISSYYIQELIDNKSKVEEKYKKRINDLEKQYKDKLKEEEIRTKKLDELLEKEGPVDIVPDIEHEVTKLKHGELLDVKVSEDILIIKGRIEPSYNNEATRNQNGFNVEDIILNQGGDKFNEIQYWAIAKLEGGSESKVISFTLNKNQIQRVKNRNLLGYKIVEEAKDLWLLPSLRK